MLARPRAIFPDTAENKLCGCKRAANARPHVEKSRKEEKTGAEYRPDLKRDRGSRQKARPFSSINGLGERKQFDGAQHGFELLR